MQLRLFVALILVLGALTQGTLAQPVSPDNAIAAAVPPRKVISWVAPYAIPQTRARLANLYGGVGPRNALTHLALQFWTPTKGGDKVARSTKYGAISNQTINGFVTWGHSNGIKVLLCVYNGENGWDWSLVQASIKPQTRNAFIGALIAQMQALKLDGIDVDLEGAGGEYPADKANYVAFVRELARRVHLLGKIVPVDSFPAQWNAPNWNWWAALFPHVDAINSMGYEELGRNGAGWQSYVAQKSKAGAHSAKLNIGIPSYLPSWLGNTTLQQVQWFRTTQAGRVGIAIWDAQFPDASWKSAPVWNNLRYIRQH